MKTRTTKPAIVAEKLLHNNNSSNKKRIFILTTILLLLASSIVKIYGQTTHYFTDEFDLRDKLGYSTYDAPNNCEIITSGNLSYIQGDILRPDLSLPANTEFDLDLLVAADPNFLYLIVPSGLILEGTYDLLGNNGKAPDGTLIKSSRRFSYADAIATPSRPRLKLRLCDGDEDEFRRASSSLPLLLVRQTRTSEGGIFAIPANSNNPECNDFFRQSRESRFGAAVGDSLSFDEYPDENTYKAKASAYEGMKKDTTILYEGNSNDVAFQNFFSDLSETNIGNFTQVNELASDSNTIEQAATLNDAIVDTNSIEYFKKTVNDIYLNKTAIGIPLSAADSSTLDYIAHLSWIQAGEAIYQSAAILGLEIHPTYVSMRKGHTIPQEKPKQATNKIKIHPNPASDKLTVTGMTEGNNEMEIYDGYGKLVYKNTVAEKSYEINLSKFANGVYNLKINNSSNNFNKIHFAVIR